jgi:1-acyl-sn-glycerol-3-phosphate acyltransferase
MAIAIPTTMNRTRASPYHPPPLTMTTFLQRAAQEVIRVAVGSAMRPFCGPSVENPPDWKKVDGVIFAPNHNSYLDPILFQAAVPRPIRFMMTETIYRIRAFRWLFDLWDTIPVPDGDAVKVSAMKDALRAVRSGQPLVIFPEGGIARNGRLQPGMPGVTALMARARAPVIPVAILGTYALLPFHANFPRITRTTIRFGAPIPPPPEDADREAQRAFAAHIMDAIAALGARR